MKCYQENMEAVERTAACHKKAFAPESYYPIFDPNAPDETKAKHCRYYQYTIPTKKYVTAQRAVQNY